MSQIFQVYGEEAFRGHETSILRSLEPSPIVLATGGGIVMREENWLEFQRLGITIYLSATRETLLERLEASKKKRPLLETENWQQRATDILNQRLHLYQRADLTVDVDHLEIPQAVEKVRRAIDEHEADLGQA